LRALLEAAGLGDARILVGSAVAGPGSADGAGGQAAAPVANDRSVDGPLVDGPLVDGPLVDGPLVDGPLVDGPLVDGPLVSDVAMDCGQVRPGALFACVKGARADGHDFAAEALGRGAVALLCERHLDVPAPQVVVRSVRRVLGPVSAALWGVPSSAMRVVGVTGTNGKTTTCALIAAVLAAEGWGAEVIGTLTGERTTPEAPALQRRLAGLRDQGTMAVAMEVSSHALDQYRVSGTSFAAGVFTNLSQDHLDYHGTMEAYFEAKAQLFAPGQVHLAVVNRSGLWGARLVERLEGGGVELVTFSPDDATEVVLGRDSVSFSWRGERLKLNMSGRFNVANAVAAATTAVELGAGRESVVRGLAAVPPVPGRFERVDRGQPFSVVVDFAHTPAALAEALRAARELVGRAGPGLGGPGPGGPGEGRLIVVFGAGGERDRAKRPFMGRVARELADVVVITSDNPRSEEPSAIIEQVASGAGAGAVGPVLEEDRARAIAGAVEMACPGDVVLIAGKGHERGQDFGTHVENFNDTEVASQALARLHYGGGAEGE
jgi:UDP-N-acetylmuramoyl-L-alanyl-D-glutamate--2,6-diaminopimelate ligase